MIQRTVLFSIIAVGLLSAGCKHAPLIGEVKLEPVVEARNLTKAGEPQEAFEQFEEILESEPENLTAHRGLVEAAYYAGHLEEIAERYESMAESGSKQGLGAYGLGLIAVSRGGGRMQAALTQFEKAASLMPGEADVPYRIGLIYLMNGDHQKAAASLERAIALDPNQSAFFVAMGGALAKMGKSKQALQVMSRILTLTPTASEASKARSIAARVYDPLRGTTPELAQDLKKIVAYLEKEVIQQALSAVGKILRSHPDIAFAHTLKGMAHSRLENDGEAVVAFEQALALQPENPLALIGLGDVYARLENWTKARVYYEQALILDPFYLEARKRMADLARVRGDHERLASSYAKMVLLDPANVELRRTYALSLFAAGQYETSATIYESVLRLKPDDLETLVRLGSLYAALSERIAARHEEYLDKARACLRNAHELSPENEAVLEMMSKIGE
jgi:tetratricopeptide (TPR) repeat protein